MGMKGMKQASSVRPRKFAIESTRDQSIRFSDTSSALLVPSHSRPPSIQLDMTRTSQRLTKVEEYAQLLDKFDTFLFDCDGVIWTGPKLVPGVTDVLNLLRSRGECGIHSSLRSDTDSLALGENRKKHSFCDQQCEKEPGNVQEGIRRLWYTSIRGKFTLSSFQRPTHRLSSSATMIE
jgi:hypothetical protein